MTFDAAQVKLNSRQLRLAEVLARNYHAKQLQNLSIVNAQNKKINRPSPLLVQFDNLPEEERQAVINTAREILKIILALGYRILEPEQQLKPEDSVLETVSKEIDFDESATVDHLVSLWHSRDHGLWQAQPNLFLIAGKRMLSAGEPLLAYDILSEGVEKMGGESSLEQLTGDQYSLMISLLQQQALSLAQSGASEGLTPFCVHSRIMA